MQPERSGATRGLGEGRANYRAAFPRLGQGPCERERGPRRPAWHAPSTTFPKGRFKSLAQRIEIAQHGARFVDRWTRADQQIHGVFEIGKVFLLAFAQVDLRAVHRFQK